jgi:hypothetical protein
MKRALFLLLFALVTPAFAITIKMKDKTLIIRKLSERLLVGR